MPIQGNQSLGSSADFFFTTTGEKIGGVVSKDLGKVSSSKQSGGK
jgi:hypothetical protein